MPQIVYETKDIHGDIVKVDFIMALNSMNLKNDSIKKQIQQRLKSMF